MIEKAIVCDPDRVQFIFNEVSEPAQVSGVKLKIRKEPQTADSSEPPKSMILLSGLRHKVEPIEKMIHSSADFHSYDRLLLDEGVFMALKKGFKKEIEEISIITGDKVVFDNSEVKIFGPRDSSPSTKSRLIDLSKMVLRFELQSLPPSSSSKIPRQIIFKCLKKYLKRNVPHVFFKTSVASCSFLIFGQQQHIKQIEKKCTKMSKKITISELDLKGKHLSVLNSIFSSHPQGIKKVEKLVTSKTDAICIPSPKSSSFALAGTPKAIKAGMDVILGFIKSNLSQTFLLPINPEDCVLIPFHFEDELKDLLLPFECSIKVLVPERKIEFRCPTANMQMISKLINSFLQKTRSKYLQKTVVFPSEYRPIIMPDSEKVLADVMNESKIFLDLVVTTSLLNKAISLSDPSKRIEVRAGNVLLESLDALVISNDEQLSCPSSIGKALLNETGATFLTDLQHQLRQKPFVSDGNCFSVSLKDNSDLQINNIINVVIKSLGAYSSGPPKDRLQIIIRETLREADNLKVKKLGFTVLGHSQGYHLSDCISALIETCSSVLPRLKNVKVIKIFDLDQNSLLMISEKMMSLSPSEWTLSPKSFSPDALFLQRHDQREFVHQDLPSTRQMVNRQWYWKENFKKVNEELKKTAVLEGKEYFIPYDFDQNYQIDLAFQQGLKEVIVIGERVGEKTGSGYLIDFTNKVQKNLKTDYERKIIFKELSEPLLDPLSVQKNSRDILRFEFERDLPPDQVNNEDCVTFLIVAKDPETLHLAELNLQSKIVTLPTQITINLIFPITDQQLPEVLNILKGTLVHDIHPDFITFQSSHSDALRIEQELKTFLRKQFQPCLFPSSWTSVADSSNPHASFLIELNPSNPEFDFVSNRIHETLPLAVISKIERVENRMQYPQFSSKVEMMKRINEGREPKQMHLFHGTGSNDPSCIHQGDKGFDRRYCERGMWGQGTYFAVNASYCHEQGFVHETKAPEGLVQVFLCKVAVGDSVFVRLGSGTNLKVAPCRPDEEAKFPGQKYDSVLGSTNGSDVFVVYNDYQAYPEYLISYSCPS